MGQRIGFFKLSILVIMLFTTVVAGTAQELCEELSREIFEDTDENCSEASNENACYGFDSISATFFDEISDNFSGSGDLLDMLQLHTLHSSAFDEELEEWGIGYFRVSLENSDDPLIIMAAGDVIVENAVDTASESELGAMQAFNFTTGGPSLCTDAPNAVFIQSPVDTEVDLVINSTPLRIGSTIVMGTIDENENDGNTQDDTMWMGVIEGQLVLYPGTPQEIIIPEGFISTVLLTDNEGDVPGGNNILDTLLVPVLDPVTGEPILGPDGQPFYRQIPAAPFINPIAITENGNGIFNWSNYGFIENIPTGLLNYEVDVPTVNDDEDPATTSSNNNPPPVVTQEVVSGDDAVTECGTRNWCNAGEPWGDGRCTSDWDWNAGWYNAQLECGAIDSIPAEYAGAEQAPPPTEAPAQVAAPANTCSVTDSNGITRTYNVPQGGQFANGQYVTYQSIEDNTVLCYNGGWWCGGNTWRQGTANVSSVNVVSTTCNLQP